MGIYEWGLPLIQKSQLGSTVNNIQSQLTSLAEAISSVAQSRGSQTITLNLPKGSLNIYNNLIQYSFQAPIIYYNPSISVVPINYNIYIPCNVNNTISIPSSGYNSIQLCGIPNLIVKVNSSNIIIQDVNNNTLILPLVSTNNVITQYFDFNINVQNNNVSFIPQYNTGISGLSYYPECLLSAAQLSGIIQYQVACRPMYNPQTGQCEWIIIEPAGQTSTITNGNSVNVNLQYKGLNVINNPNSTVCNQLVYYYVQASVV
ncbi:hypothetical protein Nps_01165 [Candidatus Nanopusillus acidilobi]|nr:hypothetical protein Nps_01165 [Candidatus Nanopusillus acidilobi]